MIYHYFMEALNVLALLCGSVIAAMAGLVMVWAWYARKRFNQSLEIERERAMHENGILATQSKIVTVEKDKAPVSVQQILTTPESLPEAYAHVRHHNEMNRTYPNVPKRITNENYGDMPDEQPLQIEVKTALEMFTSGSIGNGEYHLGTDLETGETTYTDTESALCAAIGGERGGGKSNTLMYLCLQAALNNAKMVVIDKHAGSSQSIATALQPLRFAMAFEPVSEDADILNVLAWVQAEFEARKQVQNSSPDDFETLVVIVDEATAFFKRSDIGEPLAELLETIGQEARKYNIHAVCCGQTWSARANGGSADLRNSFSSAYVHRYKKEEPAKYLLNQRDVTFISELQTGQYVFVGDYDTRLLQAPLCTAEMIAQIASMLGGSDNFQPTSNPLPDNNDSRILATEQTDGKLLGSDTEGEAEGAKFETVQPKCAKSARVIQAFMNGQSSSAIAKEIYGVSSGRKYQDATKEINDILRANMVGAA